MSYSIVFHPEADKEYRESFLWHERKVKGLGYRFENAVDKKIETILHYPERFPKRKGVYREALVEDFPYVIVFRMNKGRDTIFISSLFHTSRNPKKKYRR
jgi:mRNA-degrading endonuclease RelE of RelBE toxin-antitoxin system